MHEIRKFLALCVTSALVVGCGSSSGGGTSGGGASGGGASGGSNGGGSALVSGIALPEEVSALPPKGASATGLRAGSLRSFAGLGTALTASALPTGSDYATAKTVKWVNEQALSRFDVLNSIFKSIGQTHYADPGNVGAGPYGALVSEIGGDKGESQQQQKTLQTWVISSTLTHDPGGADVNVVQLWIEERGHVITCVTRIWQAPTQNADGSYANYGVWSINADLSSDGTQYFVASASIGSDGASVVKVHSTEGEPGGAVYETRGILHKSGASGYGKVEFPDFNQCNGWPCQNLPSMTVAYVYDAHTVKLELSSSGQTRTVVKDRDTVVDLVNRYGLYDDQGNDVAKSRHFGFPIRDASGSYGYYGAWQGRHQVWTNGQQALAAGTTVTRGDRGPNVTAETYTVSKVYQGILVKRSYSPATLADVKDVVVNAWDYQNFNLQGDGTAWHKCTMSPPQAGAPYQPPVCDAAAFTDWASLGAGPGTQAWIQGNTSTNGQIGPSTMLAVSPGLDGLVVAGTATPFSPTAQAWVNVNVGGPIWIVWDGSGWKRKQVTAIDGNNQPTFGAGLTSYAIPDGREFYLNVMGVNYVVQCTSGACSVKLETQHVANPANVASFVPASTTFSQQSWGQTASTFRFITAPSDPKFMKLVYASVGQQDQNGGAQVGDVVTSSQWGLTATIGGAQVQFNWDYPNPSQNQGCTGCGTQQFLLDAQGDLVQLDDPIRLASITLVNGAGESHAYSLQFDGSWVSGLPELWSDLQRSNGNLTAAIQAKAVSIPAGTVVTDASDGTKQYVFKPLEVSEYLAVIADPGGLDLTAANALDLSTVPTWAPTNLGARPTGVTVKYSEGQVVQ